MISKNSFSLFDGISQSIILINSGLDLIYLNEYFKFQHRATLEPVPSTLKDLFMDNDLCQLRTLMENSQSETSSIVLKLKSRSGVHNNKLLEFALQKFPFMQETYVLIEHASRMLWLQYFDLINTYSNDLLGVANEKFEVEYISPSITQILGYSQEEFRLVDPFSIVHPDDFDAFKNKLFDAIAQKKNKVSLVNRFRKKNGEYLWAENNVSLIHDPYSQDSFKIISVTRDITAMVKTQQALEETKYLLEEAQKLAKIGNWELDLRTEQLTWPESMSLLYENDLLNAPKTGREFFAFVHPDDYDTVSQAYGKLFESDAFSVSSHHEFQFRINTPNGKLKFIKSRYRLSDPHTVKGINIDVTTEAEQHQQLINTEMTYRQLVELCPFGIGIARENQRIYVNKKLAELFEVNPDDFVHYPLDAFATNETKMLIAERMRNVTDGKKNDNHFVGKFYTAVTKTLKTFEVFTSTITWEGEEARLALIIDISELKNTQEKIVQSEAMLRMAQELSGITSWHLELNEDIKTKLQREAPAFIQSVHPEDRQAVWNAFRNCIHVGSPYDIEFRLKSRYGKYLWIAEKGNVIKDSMGMSIEIYGATRDISKEKIKEHELLQAKNVAEQAYKNQEAFFSIMSHEIRTPLNAVLGLTDLLLRKKSAEQSPEVLKALKNAGANLMYVVNGLLDLAKSKTATHPLEEIQFNLYELLRQLESSYHFLAQEKGIKFHLSMSRDLPPWTVGDMVKLYQILNNLLDNAVKFTQKGFVHLHASTVSCSDNQYVLQFDVEDTGIGIPAHKLEHIFEPFQPSTFFSDRKSSGLGLAIVKNLVGHVGGSLSIKHKISAGTTFSVTIPFHCLALPPSSSITDGFKELARRKILYIDDVETNQYVVQNLLNIHHVTCDVASTGANALTHLKRKKYDVILLDLQLPDINGHDLLNHIKKTKLNALTPIIIFTADVTEAADDAMVDASVREVVYKPFVTDELLKKIIQVIINNNRVGMTYYERLLDNDKHKIAKAKEFILDDLNGLKRKWNLCCKKKNIDGLKRAVHKAKVTLTNINASKLLGMLDNIQRPKDKKTWTRLQGKINRELDYTIATIKDYAIG